MSIETTNSNKVSIPTFFNGGLDPNKTLNSDKAAVKAVSITLVFSVTTALIATVALAAIAIAAITGVAIAGGIFIAVFATIAVSVSVMTVSSIIRPILIDKVTKKLQPEQDNDNDYEYNEVPQSDDDLSSGSRTSFSSEEEEAIPSSTSQETQQPVAPISTERDQRANATIERTAAASPPLDSLLHEEVISPPTTPPTEDPLNPERDQSANAAIERSTAAAAFAPVLVNEVILPPTTPPPPEDPQIQERRDQSANAAAYRSALGHLKFFSDTAELRIEKMPASLVKRRSSKLNVSSLVGEVKVKTPEEKKKKEKDLLLLQIFTRLREEIRKQNGIEFIPLFRGGSVLKATIRSNNIVIQFNKSKKFKVSFEKDHKIIFRHIDKTANKAAKYQKVSIDALSDEEISCISTLLKTALITNLRIDIDDLKNPKVLLQKGQIDLKACVAQKVSHI